MRLDLAALAVSGVVATPSHTSPRASAAARRNPPVPRCGLQARLEESFSTARIRDWRDWRSSSEFGRRTRPLPRKNPSEKGPGRPRGATAEAARPSNARDLPRSPIADGRSLSPFISETVPAKIYVSLRNPSRVRAVIGNVARTPWGSLCP
ncbi:hypothetical protein THAOC_29652 [Thalassiosira oceanica]|uniref:Uncharacterized protein n=1 Tax=Thalassiosira oceanica TaxID=159749 RepID=K0RWY0_THAOC|nr:hypothetical protein THAOC_29652 [Thalassiosira oceanica]|eukprot:EJK51197.1 hypothetical protein THAOC_29652 [Thalassiosira oceanica]